MKKLDLKVCFTLAWRSFAKWWLLLCAVVAVPVVCSLCVTGSHSLGGYLEEYREVRAATESIMLDEGREPAQKIADLQEWMEEYKAGKPRRSDLFPLFIAILVVVTIVMQVVLILCSKRATDADAEKGGRELKRGLGRSLGLSLSYVVLAFCKLLPFVVLLLPFAIAGIIAALIWWPLAVLVFAAWFLASLWFYVRWYFTDYIITGESANPFAALAESWRLTSGEQPAVWCLVLVAFATHLPALVTLGLSTIPTRSFDFTLRAVAYRQLKGEITEC